MDLRGEKPTFFATDLTNYLGCRHLTVLERLAAVGRARRPHFDDPMLELLREKGFEHEQEYVRRFARAGKRIVEISRNGEDALAETIAAMASGAEVIVQARVAHGSWAGWADVLLRVPGESRFGTWKYEPVETKLAKTTRGTTLIQLCLYADLLAEMQGSAPEVLRVVVPERKFKPECYRFDEFRAYYRLVRRKFEEELSGPLPEFIDTAEPYPEPVAHCSYCNWFGMCDKRWARDDSVSLVAGIQRTQRKALATVGIKTLAGLAELPLPLPFKPSRGSVAALERAREQARLQFEARQKGRPGYELLPVEAEQGLAALPPPSALDLFLDFEGDAQAEHGGFEYLFGYAFREGGENVAYEARWATNPVEEKRAFEQLMDVIADRRRRDPRMHVFHYAPYEPTALKRLMGRYGVRGDELDELLRQDVFVDLYGVVRKALRAGIDSYSIKRLEPFYGLAREIDLRKVSRHLRAVEYAIARKEAHTLSAELREAVRAYNRDDCVSALELRSWLERLRVEVEEKTGKSVPRPKPPEAPPEEQLDERTARIRALTAALSSSLPLERNRNEQAQWVLAHLLEWHRREDKVVWWEFFRLNEMSDEDLLDDPAAVSGLIFDSRLETTKRGSVIDRYRFPAQELQLELHDNLFLPRQERSTPAGTIEAIDLQHRTIDLKKGAARAEVHPTAAFRHERVNNAEQIAALVRLAEFVRDHGIDAPGKFRAARDLLLRHNPRLAQGIALRVPGETTIDSARRVIGQLDAGVLAIQGPPGAGKTFTAARMIVDLVRAKRRIGVTAGSHKVIRNLLDEVVRAAASEGVPLRCMQRVSAKTENQGGGVEEETDAGKAVAKIKAGAFDVVGGTSWVWSREDLSESIDVLFVDEAGQMSLANVLACAQSARSLVLLGDPQQLEQPQQASHPLATDVSALEHLLEGHDTMPEERGLFLGETWRLHPSICSFTSELFYEGKLLPRDGLERQRLEGPTPFAGAGLFFVPVVHSGNQNSSAEEVDRIAELVANLTAGVGWIDRLGKRAELSLNDILIVAPYNAQVSALAQRIPGARIGTVDKFQGQEAPVVIYSMTTSSSDEAPHGMEFLFSRHRLNVATSRARCVCILVGNPELFEPDCRTPEQIRMANAFCRYRELAVVP